MYRARPASAQDFLFLVFLPTFFSLPHAHHLRHPRHDARFEADAPYHYDRPPFINSNPLLEAHGGRHPRPRAVRRRARLEQHRSDGRTSRIHRERPTPARHPRPPRTARRLRRGVPTGRHQRGLFGTHAPAVRGLCYSPAAVRARRPVRVERPLRPVVGVTTAPARVRRVWPWAETVMHTFLHKLYLGVGDE